MKKFSTLLVALLGLSFLGTLAPLVSSNSTTDVISGASADLDYVYIEGEETQDVSSEASTNDDEDFTAFGDEDNDSQYIYMGSNSLFNYVFFRVEGMAEFSDEDEEGLTWQYNDGDSWKSLDVNEEGLENFTAIGTHSISFDVPSDWEQFDFEDENAYWIRVSADGETDKGATIEQISARVLNIQVTVTNDSGSYLKDLDSTNFGLGQGDDTRIYSVENLGSGAYALAVQTEETDVDYMLSVSVEGYLDQGINVLDVDTDTQSYKVQLTPNGGCTVPFLDIDFHWAQSAITTLYCRGIIEGDGSNFMVNHTVTRAEFLKMAIMNASIDTSKYDGYTVPFSDVEEDDWYYEYVSAAYRLDAIDEDSRYNPDASISRVEALTLLVRLEGVETDEESTRFSDINSSDWYASTVRVATDYDVVEGYPDGTFRPENNLTRAEAAVMVDNAYRAWVQD